MPTANCRAFVPRAIRLFQRQDYPRLNLIVVDDGDDSVADCMPDDPRIRYIRPDRRMTIGAKRNLACSEARGAIIAHWDDDDWYPPHRITAQVRALLDRPADLCGSSRLYYHEAATDRAWRYQYAGPNAPWVAGNTLAYRRDYWERNPFVDLQVGEDTHFVWGRARKVVCDLADPSLCVATLHAGNTARKDVGGPFWHPEAPETVRRWLDDDPRAATAASLAPLVSCIMPTKDRRRFLPLALEHYLAQDYPHTELIIVDDGDDPVGDLAEGLPGVRYLRLSSPTTIGGKRNRACREARGEFIAHWDDDDWYASCRLSRQVAPLIEGRADMTGLENSYVLVFPAGAFWTTTADLHRRMFLGDVHGGTLVYRKALIDQGLSYPEINLAEDAHLIHQALRRGRRLARLPNEGSFVYVRHGRNAWKFETGRFLDPSGWRPTDAPPAFSEDLLSAYREAAAGFAAAVH
jgi:O-antigen biosynthesis protein